MLGAASPSGEDGWQWGGVCVDPSCPPDGVGAGALTRVHQRDPEAQGTGHWNEQVGSAPVREGDANASPA